MAGCLSMGRDNGEGAVTLGFKGHLAAALGSFRSSSGIGPASPSSESTSPRQQARVTVQQKQHDASAKELTSSPYRGVSPKPPSSPHPLGGGGASGEQRTTARGGAVVRPPILKVGGGPLLPSINNGSSGGSMRIGRFSIYGGSGRLSGSGAGGLSDSSGPPSPAPPAPAPPSNSGPLRSRLRKILHAATDSSDATTHASPPASPSTRMAPRISHRRNVSEAGYVRRAVVVGGMSADDDPLMHSLRALRAAEKDAMGEEAAGGGSSVRSSPFASPVYHQQQQQQANRPARVSAAGTARPNASPFALIQMEQKVDQCSPGGVRPQRHRASHAGYGASGVSRIVIPNRIVSPFWVAQQPDVVYPSCDSPPAVSPFALVQMAAQMAA
ncbi:hypothetical protein FOA52_006330 [Chlamydomonas sp. UWO 241]|nr:hypothetical protein FOA52_006330 [Chlamydomonas sp. UWO 241]